MTDTSSKPVAAAPAAESRSLADIVAEIEGIENYAASVSFDALRDHRAAVSLTPEPSIIGTSPIQKLQIAADRWIASMHAIALPPLRVEFRSPRRRRPTSGCVLNRNSVSSLAYLMRRRISWSVWSYAKEDLILDIRRSRGFNGRHEARVHGVGGVDPRDAAIIRSGLETWAAYRSSWLAGINWIVLVPDFGRLTPRRSSLLPSADIVDLLDVRRRRAENWG